MLHQTKGIVLRTIKYGDTSIVVNIYTELFGTQHYMVQGVRTEKKTRTKANLYQAGSLLDLIVYHHPQKELQRIKEAHIHFLYKTLHQDMVKNTLTVYIVELIAKTMTEPETNIELFEFFEQSLMQIDSLTSSELVNVPLLFTMQLANHLGFGIQNEYSTQTPILDLVNGRFCTQQELQSLYFVQGFEAQWISNLVIHGEPGAHLSAKNRQELLMICIRYLKLHIPHMGELKSIQVLHDILH